MLMQQRTLQLIARAVTRAYGVVVRNHPQAHTDGKTIFVPMVELKDFEDERAVHGYLDHESGHVIFTEDEPWMDAILEHIKGSKSKDKLAPVFKSMFNLLEDMRIEQAMMGRYPGSRSNLDSSAAHAGNQPLEVEKMSPMAVIFRQLFADLRQQLLAQPVKDNPELESAADIYLDGRYGEVLTVALGVEHLSSTAEVADLADQVLAKIASIIEDNTNKYGQPDPGQAQQSETNQPAPLVDSPQSSGGEAGEDGDDDSGDPDQGAQQSGDSDGEDSEEASGDSEDGGDPSEDGSDADSGEQSSGDSDNARNGDTENEQGGSDDGNDESQSEQDAGEDDAEDGDASSDSDQDGDEPTDGDEGEHADSSAEDTEDGDNSSDADSGEGEESESDAGESEAGQAEDGEGESESDTDDEGAETNGGEADAEQGDSGSQDGQDGDSSTDGAAGQQAGEKGAVLTDEDLEGLEDLTDEEQKLIDVAKAIAQRIEEEMERSPWTGLYEQTVTAESIGLSGLSAYVSSTASRMQALLEDRVQVRRKPRVAGALNRRALHRARVGDPYIFTRDFGEDYDTRANVVMLLDRSGSMDGEPASCLAQSSFVISSALESFGVHTAIMAFGDSQGTTLVKDWEDRANQERLIPIAHGGTPLAPALQWANAFLENPPDPQAKRIVITLTDGYPSQIPYCLALTEEMVNKGIQCSFVGIMCDLEAFQQYPTCIVESVADLPGAFAQLAIDNLIGEIR